MPGPYICPGRLIHCSQISQNLNLFILYTLCSVMLTRVSRECHAMVHDFVLLRVGFRLFIGQFWEIWKNSPCPLKKVPRLSSVTFRRNLLLKRREIYIGIFLPSTGRLPTPLSHFVEQTTPFPSFSGIHTPF